jgi:hypothetical protein
MDSPLEVPGDLRAISWSSFALRYAFAFTGVPDPPKFVLLLHQLRHAMSYGTCMGVGTMVPQKLLGLDSSGLHVRNGAVGGGSFACMPSFACRGRVRLLACFAC